MKSKGFCPVALSAIISSVFIKHSPTGQLQLKNINNLSYDENDMKEYNHLIIQIGSLLANGRKQAYCAVNHILVKTYWEIGKRIVEYEQQGKEKAEYGSGLLNRLSKDLKLKYGRGFSRRNVLDMRRFYLTYPIWQTVSAELSWSHYIDVIINVGGENDGRKPI